jgi:lipase maturation factor 1
VQIRGLVGARGILPARGFLDAVASALGATRYWWVPSLFWLHPTDGFLDGMCAAGSALGILLILGVAPVASLAGLWLLYLSLQTIGQDFLSFQWDLLLLEAGFLAIFLAPLQLRPGLRREQEPPRPIVWLFRWLVFRLIVSSGAVKLLSGDPTWRNLTALEYHYWTQPLPTWIGWYANLLPGWFQEISCALMFAIELGAPILIWNGPRARLAAFVAFVTLQILIAITGNYGFFNLLTITLCVMLLDDASWPSRLRRWRDRGAEAASGFAWPRPLIGLAAGVLLLLSLLETFTPRWIGGAGWPQPLVALRRTAAPLRLVGSYGLFAVMTTARPEITVEGSDDGSTWREYEFRWKAGDPAHAPSFVEPYQPRLDWQMWFAALGRYQDNPWFLSFVLRLLEGSREVTALLEHDPFSAHPPKYARAILYQYRFTDLAERRASGQWWKRERQWLYLPAVSLESFRRPQE